MNLIYHHDFVVCIEATSNVKPYASQLHNTFKKYFKQFLEYVDEKDYPLGNLRIKFILFRDFACCAEPIFETDFFNMDSSEDFSLVDEFIEKIEFKGGYGYCNALEAIALALQSKWITLEGYRRYTILVFSNGQVRPLGGNQKLLSKYPKDMPKNFEELSSIWQKRTYLPVRGLGFLTAFVPNMEPWRKMMEWDCYWPAFTENMGSGFCNVDLCYCTSFYFYEDFF